MELNGVGLITRYNGISGSSSCQSSECNESYTQDTGKTINLDISGIGKMFSAISQMSEEDKAEIKAFHDEVTKAVNNGTYDLSELMANAPKSLVNLAEKTDDLEQIIESMASGPPPVKGAPPPLVMRSMGENSELTDEEKDEIDAFMADLLESVNNGTFDASVMAQNAPESLVSLAEETGNDLEQIIENMASGPRPGMGASPPPPPMMYDSKGMGLSFDNEENYSLLSSLTLSDEITGTTQVA